MGSTQKAMPMIARDINFSRASSKAIGFHEGVTAEDGPDSSCFPEGAKNDFAQDRVSTALGEKILALYDEFRPRLFRYICSLNLNRDQAEEVIQETFLRLTTKLMQGRADENIQGWIVRVAHNVAVDLLEKRNIGAERSSGGESALNGFVDPTPNPEQAYSTKEQAKRMSSALSTLTSQQRQCFELRSRGFRYKDIALAQRISEQRAAFVVKQAAVQLAKIFR